MFHDDIDIIFKVKMILILFFEIKNVPQLHIRSYLARPYRTPYFKIMPDFLDMPLHNAIYHAILSLTTVYMYIYRKFKKSQQYLTPYLHL